MSDVHGSTAPSGNQDSPLDKDEAALFEQMRNEGPSDPSVPADTATPPPAATAPVAPPATDTEDDGDDGDDEPAAPAAGSAPASTAPGQPGQPPKRVSFHKFQRIEQKAKKAEAEAIALRKQIEEGNISRAKIEERLNLINEALTTPAQRKTEAEQDPEPNPDEDIFGHNAWLKRQIVKMDGKIAEMNAGRQAEQTDTKLVQDYMQAAQTFAQEEPAFPQAYNHLMQSRTVELAQYFFGKDLFNPETPRLTAQEIGRIRQVVADEEKTLVKESIQQGQDPARRIMALAMARGFQRPQASAPKAAANGSPPLAPAVASPPPAAAPANGAPSVKDEIDRIKAGTEASLSLSGGGGAPAPSLTFERLANMNDAEFKSILDNADPAQLRAVLGG